MKSRRLSLSILTICLILALVALPVKAQEVPANLQEAAGTLREGIKNWENLITVTFTVDQDSFDGTTASANDLANRVLELALAHTGVPDEGDYLRFNIGYMETNSVSFAKGNTGWQFTVTYYIAYRTAVEQEAEVDAQIEKLVADLGLKGDLTDYQKISVIYQYVTGNVAYDYENLEDENYGLKFTTYAAVVNKTAVCQGYATLFYRLALEAGVDNRVITGYAGEDHAWNLVALDGKYYFVDATWDSEQYEYLYFLKSSADFWDHDPDPEYETEEFLTAYPQAEQSYDLPDVEHAFDGDFEYLVNKGRAALICYNGVEQDVVVPSRLGGYPVYWVATGAFQDNMNIVSLTFSEGIQIIESEAILSCQNLKEIHLPSTVDFTASKDPDFQCRVVCGASFCPSVETITVAEGNPNLVVYDGVLYSKDMTFLRYYPAGDPREVFEIPEGVLCIGAKAISDNVYLKEIKMPDTVRRLQMACFENCSQLKTINISNGCVFIDQYVFSKTGLESIHIPASVEMLYSGSFGINSKVSHITVDPANPYYYVVDDVLYGHYTEENIACDWYSPYLGDWLVRYPTSLDATVFTVPEGIVGIEQEAFSDCVNLTEVILPDSLQAIAGGAFYFCSGLCKIDLPDNLKAIEAQPFWECTSLVELVIPASVKTLSHYLMGQGDGGGLENVVFLGDMPEMTDQTFYNLSVDIYYPAGNTTWEKALRMYSGNTQARWHEACETHQFSTVSREATCEATGYTGQECSVCGLVEVASYVPAMGHDLIEIADYEPACTQEIPVFYKCRNCAGGVMQVVEPVGHSFNENGYCVRCGANGEGDLIPQFDTGGLGEQELILILLGGTLCITAALGIGVLIVKAISKPKKKESSGTAANRADSTVDE